MKAVGFGFDGDGFFESRRGARGSRREGDAGWGHPAYRVAAGRPVIPKK